ncbi:7,8-dihydro-8-oxoguanine triphosphatase-like protein [Tribonema minus]|uniref:Oxidized purine nucleoside triphosphate hydrolase n=1 Tax=Tribonema minus TaxID=303371 RepID=A0A835YJU4_9STRA|nr:7,8-dihydro-8-oxoguanine triphosphatase-like protein [Tribonema minus]
MTQDHGTVAALPQEKQPQDLTLVFCRRRTADGPEILLGLKKKGFGTGKWNGFGGKVEAGESIEVAAKRELLEEAGVTATKVAKRGHLTFVLDSYEHIMKVHLYEAVEWHGEPTESDEMAPRWYREDALPFELMWADDAHWMPLFLAGKSFEGEFIFKPDSVSIDTHWLREASFE